MVVLRGTSAASPAGLVESTVGGVVSAPPPVVKLHTKSATNGLPAMSLAPVVIVAV